MKEQNNLLIIFTRNIELGKCKTRLARRLGDEKALEIYRILVSHTAQICQGLKVDKWVFYSEFPQVNDAFEDRFFKKFRQQGPDLGARMKHAFHLGFKAGYVNVVIIGSDIMDLSKLDLVLAFKQLETNEFVIGPAQDGGYYLLGMKKLMAGLFSDKSWGSNRVLAQTLKDLESEQVYIMDQRNDVDVYEDLIGIPEFENFINGSE